MGTQGYVRFENEGAAQKAIDAVKAANEDKIVIKEKECEVKVIEGIEEKVPPKLGCVMHFKGCSTDTVREDLKAMFGEHEPIEWVDFERGETQGYIRFENEGAAQKAIDAVKAANED